jgi:hypothetical protein
LYESFFLIKKKTLTFSGLLITLAHSEVGANSLDPPHTETKGREKAQNLCVAGITPRKI